MPKGNITPVRRAYGGPWSKMAGGVELSGETLDRLGRALVTAVVKEAKKDFAKRGTKPHQPEGIPDSRNFFQSFSYRVVGKKTVELTSTWPWIAEIVEGRDPYPMKWATRERGVDRVPIVQDNGTVVFRMTPLKTEDAWIHPGFAKHTFLARGIRKGREAMAKIILEELKNKLLAGDISK